MSETYIITAKTVDEAIAIANREYADADHEVAYDIIDMPKKGFFGIGARDAKIKITVSKVQKVELGSLVDDIRSMKTLTDRGGSRTPEKKTKPAVNVTAKNVQKPAQNGQKSTQNAQTQKSAKPAQPKQNQPKTEKSAEKPVQKKPVENAQPKSDKPQNQQNQQKPAQKPAEKPQNQNQQKPKAEAKPAEKPVENKPVEAKQKPAQPKVETKVEAKTEPVQTTEAKAEKTYTSHLGNEVKRTRRPERKPQHTENIPSSGVTVSSPVGLSDFSGTKNGGFGSGEYKSGRISNDIKKKPAQNNVKPVTDPAKANRDALKALTFDVDAHEKAKAEEAAPVVTKAERPAKPAKPARQNKPQQKPAEKAQPKEEKYPESALVKTDAQPAADASAEKRLREGVTQAEMDFALDFANTLLENMKLDAKAVPAEANGDEYIINGEANVYPRINIIGADTGILIGHHGETLDAIQYLVNLSALRKSKQKDGDYVKIVVDIEGYREKREETLRTLARRMAARAVKYKRNVFLEPMNAYERRIIHSELQSFENVSTHSVGADKDRKIIITYEGPDKRERPDRRRQPADVSATETVDESAVETVEVSAQAFIRNEEKRRPKKPVKLPIDKLTDLLESREDGYVTSDGYVAHSEEEKVVSEADTVEAIETVETVETSDASASDVAEEE